MPLIKPDIQAALRAVGIGTDPDASIGERLDQSGLSLERALEELSDLAHASGNESTRLRAIETSLKLRGILKEQAAPPPSVTITIQDNRASEGINPILLPRQLSSLPTKGQEKPN